ncbi:MATE family efflux transporter [Bacteroidales bacterium]|nr:MATE family efflux transporter [Bacteroidales bacterium]
MQTQVQSYSGIWKVAYPIFLTLLVQNMIQVVATAFLGRVGEVELGASALAGIYYIVIFMLAFGFSTGSQILIGRRNGEGQYGKIGEIVVNGVLFLLSMALVLFLFTRFFSEPILSRLLSSEPVLEAALKYLDWRMYGLFFSSINVMFRAFYIGITRTKVLTVNALLMASVNIFLDYALIFGEFGCPEMGIAGAAIAAIASEFVSVLFFVGYTFYAVDFEKYGFRGITLTSFKVITNILSISLSLMFQYFLSLGTWFFFFLAIEHLGEKPLAISNIIRSLYMIVAIPIFSLSATANTLVSNAIGAGKQDEVLPLVWKISRLALFISMLFIVVILSFPEYVLSVYTDNTSLIKDSIPSLIVVMSVMPIIALRNVFFSSVSGTGNTKIALYIEIITLLIYVFYMWLVIRKLQFPLHWCWTSEHVSGGLIFILSFVYLRSNKWRDKKI